MTVYVDSSAVAKLLVHEEETEALVAYLSGRQQLGIDVATSFLTETELRRVCVREQISQQQATLVLDGFELLDVDPPLFRAAGILENRELRSLDALHIASALRFDAAEFLTYDARQAQAAIDVGLTVVSPP